MSDSTDFLSQLNPNQQEAVTHKQGPLLILAGAGSGKTRALTYRAVYLIKEKKVSPKNIILLTFTNKAAEEMKTRIKKMIGKDQTPFAGTFHSFCARLLRREENNFNLPKNFVIYDRKDQKEVIKQAMLEEQVSTKKFRPRSILDNILQAKNELIGPQEYPQYAYTFFQKTVAQIYLRYQKLLKEYQALDFADLLFETVKMLGKKEAVLNKYQNQYRHILVDEYQDTNYAQYELTKLLSGRWRNLCVVGDCAQSIYAWRGADYRNLMKLKKDFPDLKIVNLEQNYRSTKTILQAANQVIVQNESHPILDLWTKNKKGKKVGLYQAKNELDEASFVASKIRKVRFFNPKNSLDQFAILYRTNAQSRIIEEAFLKNGLPYRLVGGTHFYDRKEIKDCLAYLRLLANPSDFISYQRAQKLGKRRLDNFFKFAKKAKGKDLTSAKVLDEIFKATGYLELYHPEKEEDLARLENIKELYSVAAQFPNLTNFLEKTSLMQKENLPQNQPQENSQNKVTLMTAHAAKGTEFKTVFIVGLEEGLFPHSRSMNEKEKLEEERRLCYVGITRAKKKLFLSHAKRRLYFGRKISNPPSRFLQEIPDNLIKVEKDSI